jgi:hypothetical protein
MATSDYFRRFQAERHAVDSAAACRGPIYPRSASEEIRPRMDVVSADLRSVDAVPLDQEYFFPGW